MIRISARGAVRTIGTAAVVAAALLAAVSPASAAAVPIEDRVYTVKVTTFRAFDETGPFNSGLSDEIYAGFRTQFPSGSRSDVETRLMGDFDAGDTRTVPSNQNCLSPSVIEVNNGSPDLSGFSGDAWFCASVGVDAPFSVTGVLFESDTDINPNPFEFNPRGIRGVLDRRAEDDDSLGTRTVSFSAAGLAADLPALGQVRNYTSDFTGGGGHYRVTYQVQRVF